MPAGKIKESLWLGTARIFLSSLRGQGGVRQLDGALGGAGQGGCGVWAGLQNPKRPRVQVPAESNQGEIWECHSCSQRRRSTPLLSPPGAPRPTFLVPSSSPSPRFDRPTDARANEGTAPFQDLVKASVRGPLPLYFNEHECFSVFRG